MLSLKEGSGVANLVDVNTFHAAIRSAGLEIVDYRDRAKDSVIPWHSLLQPQWAVSDFKSTPIGRWLTHVMLSVFELVRLAPHGSVEVHRTLCKGADGLVAGGIEGIFTPMYMVVARKPQVSQT